MKTLKRCVLTSLVVLGTLTAALAQTVVKDVPQVVGGTFFDALARGDLGVLKSHRMNGAAELTQKDLDDTRRILGTQTLEVQAVYVAAMRHRALVVSSPVSLQVDENQPPQVRRFLLDLDDTLGRWLVRDIDFKEDEESVKAVESFYDTYAEYVREISVDAPRARKFDHYSAPGGGLTVFEVRYADAHSVAGILSELFDDFAIVVDERTGSLFIRYAEGVDIEELAQVFEVLDREGVPPQESPYADDLLTTEPAGSFLAGLYSGQPEQNVHDVRTQAEESERRSIEMALRWRAVRQGDESDENADEALEHVRNAVEEAFAARQELQRTELEVLRRRLATIESQIESREEIRDRIIDRRVEELLDPALTWDLGDAGDSLPPEGAVNPLTSETGGLPGLESSEPQPQEKLFPPEDERVTPLPGQAPIVGETAPGFPGTDYGAGDDLAGYFGRELETLHRQRDALVTDITRLELIVAELGEAVVIPDDAGVEDRRALTDDEARRKAVLRTTIEQIDELQAELRPVEAKIELLRRRVTEFESGPKLDRLVENSDDARQAVVWIEAIVDRTDSEGNVSTTAEYMNGTIISPDGLIAVYIGYGASEEVAANSLRKVIVTVNERTSHQARLLAYDPKTGAALLKIDATGLPWLKLGDDPIAEDRRLIVHGRGDDYLVRASVRVTAAHFKLGDLDGCFAVAESNQHTVTPECAGAPLVTTSGQLQGIVGENEGPRYRSDDYPEEGSRLRERRIIAIPVAVIADLVTKVESGE